MKYINIVLINRNKIKSKGNRMKIKRMGKKVM